MDGTIEVLWSQHFQAWIEPADRNAGTTHEQAVRDDSYRHARPIQRIGH